MTSLILPAFNPGPEIDRTWAAVRKFVADRAARGDSWEAVFVLDGCTDGTADRLARLNDESDPRIRVIGYPVNRGKGHAVRTGLLAARGEYRVFTDVDLAYSFTDTLRIADILREGAVVAVASRSHPESVVTLPVKVLGYAYRRQFQSRVFGFVTRRLLPIAQQDTQAGLKGMTAAVAERIVPALHCDGFGFDCELLAACVRSGVPVTEVPVGVRYDSTASTTGMRTTLRMLREVWRIRRRLGELAVPAVPVAESLPSAKAA